MKKILVALGVLVVTCGISWLLVCGITKLITVICGITFTWKIGTITWLVLFILNIIKNKIKKIVDKAKSI